MSASLPSRRWHQAAGRAMSTVALLGGIVAASPQTLQAHAGPVRTSMAVDCSKTGQTIRAVMVDLMNRTLVPLTTVKGEMCVASVPFAWSGNLTFVSPEGRVLSGYDVQALVFGQENLRQLLSVYGPSGRLTGADSAKVAEGRPEAMHVWRILEQDPETKTTRALPPIEGGRFLAQVGLYLNNQSRLGATPQASQNNDLVSRMVRDTQRQATWRTESAVANVVASALRRVF